MIGFGYDVCRVIGVFGGIWVWFVSDGKGCYNKEFGSGRAGSVLEGGP